LIMGLTGEKISQPTFSENIYLALIGLCFFASTMTLFYAFNFTTIANATFLHYTFPILTTIGAIFLLKEKLGRWEPLSIALSIIGLSLIFKPSFNACQKMWIGNLSALLSAIPVAGLTLIGRKINNKSAFFITFWGTFYAALMYLPFFLFNNTISNFTQVFYLFWVSVWFTGITAPLYFYSLKQIQASTAGILLLIEVISATALGLIFYREVPPLMNLIGGLFVVSGVVIVMKSGMIEEIN